MICTPYQILFRLCNHGQDGPGMWHKLSRKIYLGVWWENIIRDATWKTWAKTE